MMLRPTGFNPNPYPSQKETLVRGKPTHREAGKTELRLQQEKMREERLRHRPQMRFISDNKEGETKDYRWVVDVAGVGGAVVGGLFFGPAGVVIGGALMATLAVPLRRYLAEKADRKSLANDIGLGTEMGVTAGSSLLFGALFMGGSIIARGIGTRVASAFATRAAAAAGRHAVAERTVTAVWQPLKRAYVGRGHISLRLAGGAAAAYDLTHDKEGNWDPENLSLDTGWGFAGAIYSGNLLYGKFFGTNVFGLDTAAPMSIATYQLFRVLAGAHPTDFGEFNFNEAIRFRYISEFGNIIQLVATYGRAYLRPDLRVAIAAEKGLTASEATGSGSVSPFGWLLDNTLGVGYRRLVPAGIKAVIRPTVQYPEGPLVSAPKWSGRWGERAAERLTLLSGFKGGDMMRPEYGHAGRFLVLGQVWALVVPYQIFGAPMMGMSAKEWGPNRYWKMTSWSLIGSPVKSGLGGDTPMAQGVGFLFGMAMDVTITQWYDPRYKAAHWRKDFEETLTAYTRTEDEQAKQKLADHIVWDIYAGKMTDWNLQYLLLGNGLNKFNEEYLAVFDRVATELDPALRISLKEIGLRLEKQPCSEGAEPFEKEVRASFFASVL